MRAEPVTTVPQPDHEPPSSEVFATPSDESKGSVAPESSPHSEGLEAHVAVSGAEPGQPSPKRRARGGRRPTEVEVEKRVRQVATLLARGLTPRMIAAGLGTPLRTVERYAEKARVLLRAELDRDGADLKAELVLRIRQIGESAREHKSFNAALRAEAMLATLLGGSESSGSHAHTPSAERFDDPAVVEHQITMMLEAVVAIAESDPGGLSSDQVELASRLWTAVAPHARLLPVTVEVAAPFDEYDIETENSDPIDGSHETTIDEDPIAASVIDVEPLPSRPTPPPAPRRSHRVEVERTTVERVVVEDSGSMSWGEFIGDPSADEDHQPADSFDTSSVREAYRSARSRWR